MLLPSLLTVRRIVQNQSVQKSVQRGKKCRILPVSANAVMCLIQVFPQLLALISKNYKTTIENIKIAAQKLLLRRLFLIRGVLLYSNYFEAI